jgi:amino acid transporter/nucleotide-binding universal stress UspA family protein
MRWYHAAGVLFADWGTSRLYVLGLAFAMLTPGERHASFWYVAAMCVLVTLVGFSYTIICRHFPDGGGVYSAARHRSHSLAVLGALLLVADYVVTAALSAYDGFRYLLPSSAGPEAALYAAAGAIAVIGLLNIFGPRRIGTLVLLVAVISIVFYAIIGFACAKHLPAATIAAPTEPFTIQWYHFVSVILALSGVEAIANMTGIMAEPVSRNARKAILLVLAEVVVLNLLMAYAMNALTDTDLASFSIDEQRDHMVKILATAYVGPWFAAISAIFFGLLLVFAANTAIGDMVSIQYLMSRDKELPGSFTRLNRFGMPWLGLVVATLVPIIVLLIVGHDTETLAGLYAIGVVGAITINMLTCGTNPHLDLKRWERIWLISVGVAVGAVEVTIALDKPQALAFATVVLGTGLAARFAARREWPQMQVTLAGLVIGGVLFLLLPEFHFRSLAFAGILGAALGFAHLISLRIPVAAPVPAPSTPRRALESLLRRTPITGARLLVPTRGNPRLMRFAADYAHDKKAALFVLFVREVALAFRERGAQLGTDTMTLENDKEAQGVFEEARRICDKQDVPMVPLYAVYDSPAELILDQAATMGVDAVIMGVSKRGALWKTLKGDVLQEVVNYLPDSIPLLIHA